MLTEISVGKFDKSHLYLKFPQISLPLMHFHIMHAALGGNLKS